MNASQNFEMSGFISENYDDLFVVLIVTVIFAYVFLAGFNFLRQKYLLKEASTYDFNLPIFILILQKLFFYGGIGFIVGNCIERLFNEFKNNALGANNWNYLVFGIILIFLGIALKSAKKAIALYSTEKTIKDS